MRILFRERRQGEIDFGLLYGGIVLLGLAAAMFLPVAGLLPSCYFRGIFGIPCPTCGATRSVMSLVSGDVAAALAFNPLIAAMILASLAVFFVSLVIRVSGLRAPLLIMTEKEKKAARFSVLALVLANWAYLAVAL